jgi:hypothetical protein
VVREIFKGGIMEEVISENQNAETGFSRPTNADSTIQQVASGIIKEFGQAPYKHYDGNDPSYYITLDHGGRSRTLWGVHLKDALTQSNLGLNDDASIFDLGTVPVQIELVTRDDAGAMIKQETKTVQKRLWRIEPRIERHEKQVKRDNQRQEAGTKIPLVETKKRRSPPLSESDVSEINRIWKDVPRKIAVKGERSLELVIEGKKKITVTKDRIEFDAPPRQRPEAAYLAACNHARQFWEGEMEVHGDKPHLVKSWAYASAHGIRITNYEPTGSDLEDAQKMLATIRAGMNQGFSRPASKKASGPKP